MLCGPFGTHAIFLPRLLGLGLLFAWTWAAGASPVEAGCGVYAGADMELLDGPKRGGQLTLKLYAQYSAGGIFYTYIPAVPPCHGLQCGAAPRMTPIVSPPWGFRLGGSFAIDSPLRTNRILDDHSPGATDHPRSTFAPRGGIEAPEHPPKLFFA
jgi:hypothetical protein